MKEPCARWEEQHEACAVFVMSEVEGLPGTEVAARLGLTLPMAYARIRAVRGLFGQRVARERLRKRRLEELAELNLPKVIARF